MRLTQHGERPATASLAAMFPHLTHLRVNTAWHYRNGSLLQEYAENSRSLNVSEQLSTGTWPALEMFQGNALDLYVMGILCHISEVTIEVCSETLRLLPDIISSAHPISLQITLSRYPWPADYEELLQTIVGLAGLNDLRSFSLSPIRLAVFNFDDASPTVSMFWVSTYVP